MSSKYYYYQTVGGDESWKPVDVNALSEIPPHMFRTILSLDTLPTDGMPKSELAAIRYNGPLYFDLDDKASPSSTAQYAVELLQKLEKLDLKSESASIYATGGKGFHITVPQACFLEKVSPRGYLSLPLIYKTMAFELSVASMDFRVYTARRGRMFRMPNIKRENGLYKVQISLKELKHIASLPRPEAEEAYKLICSEPRAEFEPEVKRAFGLQGLFEQTKKRVEGFVRKAAKAPKVDLPDNLPSFDALLRGEGVRSDAGFHQIAMQVVITAHAREISCDDLIQAAEGLIQNHQSDGGRYDTPDKRRYELRRMYDYTEDNPCYGYAPGAIRSLLTHQAPDLAGLEVDEEEIAEALDNPEQQETTEYDHAGVFVTSAGVSVPAGDGVRKALALRFDRATELVSSTTGNASVLQADVSIPGGQRLGTRNFELEHFNSASALNKAVMPFGQVFTGNDAQARGVYLRLIEKARGGGRRVYVVNREGVDFVAMPFHDDPRVQEGIITYSDQQSVVVPPYAEGMEDFKLRFVGFPNPLGIYQSDLSMTPRPKEMTMEQLDLMRQTVKDALLCQTPAYLSKLVGWMTACHYRMLFHKVYNQFPLLHINGAAGAGKTSMTKLFANLHYYRQPVKMLTPGSTNFALKEAMSASSSIPMILDEYKPQTLSQMRHDEFKLMFRDAYNNREMTRGGGSRDNGDFRSIQVTQLSAPICFIAEAAESEPAVMERVILLTLVKPPAARLEKFFRHFNAADRNREQMGIVGSFIARSIVNNYSIAKLREEFDEIYDETRKELMLGEGDEDLSFEEKQKKAGTKERTVYNYSVLRFGILKFRAVIKTLFEPRKELAESNPERFAMMTKNLEQVIGIIDEMYAESTSSVQELQAQTVPEWLKVFNSLSDMVSGGDDYSSFRLVNRQHYAVRDVDGLPILEIAPRGCYTKYRMFCAARGEKSLFASEQAFIHALTYLPCRVEVQPSINVPGGTFSFDLNELRLLGFVDMPEK